MLEIEQRITINLLCFVSWGKYLSFQKLLNEPVLKLVEAQDVWWLSHGKAACTMMKCLPSVLTSLEREAEERNNVRAAGLAKLTQDHCFVMSLHMICDTLPHLTVLSTALQVCIDGMQNVPNENGIIQSYNILSSIKVVFIFIIT